MTANDPRDAAKALAKVIALTGKGDATLDAAYGEALVLDNSGAVPPEAEASFTAALAIDPHNAPARFYLGLAKASRNDRPGAIALWQSLLAERFGMIVHHESREFQVEEMVAAKGGPKLKESADDPAAPLPPGPPQFANERLARQGRGLQMLVGPGPDPARLTWLRRRLDQMKALL